MDLKTVEIDGKTYAEVKDGKPLYLDDGKEVAFDAPHTVATISRLNGEAKGHRERAEAAEGKLAAFDGIEDPAAALAALKTVKNLDDKKLIEAGEVDRIKTEAIAAIEAKYAPVVEKADNLERQLNSELIGGAFARASFIAERVAVPSDLIQAQFGRNFAVEDGKLVGKDESGNVIYSKQKPGEVASFDEALEIVVEGYRHKDRIMKGHDQSGAGSRPGSGQTTGKIMTMSEFNALDPKARAAKMVEGTTLTE
ncbi:MAG: DUF6651 domain-containing protein [Methyloligellaceae bacterium]